MSRLSSLARPSLEGIVPYEPGKPISEVQREYGLTDVVKLASNENPRGPSPKAVEAVRAALNDLHLYPDGGCYLLKERLSKNIGVPVENLVIGNGSTELIELVTEAFLGDGQEAVIGRQAFFKYRIAVQIMNGVISWAEMPGLGYDPESLLRAVSPHTRVVFIANPNNPTGTLLDRSAVEYLMSRLPESAMVVFDEAYYDYRDPAIYPDTLGYLREGRNVVILRTFSKSYGLAGLRVGYALAPAPIAYAMNAVREAFNVNSLGQIAATAALDDGEFLAESIRLNRESLDYLYRELERLGLEYVTSQANFVLIRVPLRGRELFKELLKVGVVVRPVDGYGLPDYVRVSTGLPRQNERFIQELEAVLKRIRG